ncbi:hypothetical protein [Streptomonospora alba]|uniref:hypothetical protein n=1 Tax=Streptomonospora alba TaxID=183763 RepID=UPI0006997409|nr:hypothetical protein [Streptomonospora alba]
MARVSDDDAATVWTLLSEPRTAPYLEKADGDRQDALALYEWSARTAAAAFEDVGHLEVLLRNALDSRLRLRFHEDSRRIPWFLMPLPGDVHVAASVQSVRERLREEGRESRDQIVAGLSFGFWSGLLDEAYEELWRECLHEVFPNSSGRRAQVFSVLDGVRRLRNRLAHHDSLLGVDIPAEAERIVEVARYIDRGAADWLAGRSRVLEVYRQRPVDVEPPAAPPRRERRAPLRAVLRLRRRR